MSKPRNLPFLWGAQYYRAPTPEPECWEYDLKRMKELGLNAVKFWVQWRWSHFENDRFVFDDVDRLMDLAHENGLDATLNVIFDVSPFWLYEKYPDAKFLHNNGQVSEPQASGGRAGGGNPGPCLNHPGAFEERMKFLRKTVEHFRGHPAMAMWDTWNEPLFCDTARTPDMDIMACYCPHCRAEFRNWLEAKYGSLDKLNRVWGRCYEKWEHYEMPRKPHTIIDFIDWREFCLDVVTREGARRIELVRQLDPDKVIYHHMVPSVMKWWCGVTCADDYDLAQPCDVAASSMANNDPVWPVQIASTSRDKTVYNTEHHINHGGMDRHQPIFSEREFLDMILPQIGLGVRGFMFWQYRSEVLGAEAPAWGLVKLDGSDRPVTQGARRFAELVGPYMDELMACPHDWPQIGIWKSRKNEMYHWIGDDNINGIAKAVEGYLHTLYEHNYRFRIIFNQQLERNQLDDLKMLIMPGCCVLTEGEAETLDAWVKNGGVLICDAHLGGYNASTGRYNRTVPGFGLDKRWGIREVDSVTPKWLKLRAGGAFLKGLSVEERQAYDEFTSGKSEYVPIRLEDGGLAHGAYRYAILDGDGIRPEGCFEEGEPCMVSKPVGDGFVYYFGTNLGQGARKNKQAVVAYLRKAAEKAGLRPALGLETDTPGTVHIDPLNRDGEVRFLVVRNLTSAARTIRLDLAGRWKGLFTDTVWELGEEQGVEVPGDKFIDLFVPA